MWQRQPSANIAVSSPRYTSDVLLNIHESVLAIEVFGDGTFKAVQDPPSAAVTTIKDEEPYIIEPSAAAAVKLEQV